MSEYTTDHEALRPPVPYVVHGSFRRHLNEIGSTIQTLNTTGNATAIAPHDCTAISEQDGFVLLAGEEGLDPRQVEADYLRKVLSLKARGGFSLWVNPGGYVGKSAAYEYGIAQACGIPAFFTETPDDVPFYVDPARVLSAEELALRLQQEATLGETPPTDDPIGASWASLPFPTTSVAVGGVVRFQNKILLVQDGRWQGDKLTVPGTKVRAQETRTEALGRLLGEKVGIDVRSVAPLQTSFMASGSGYRDPVHELIFDDRSIAAASSATRPQQGIDTHWLSTSEVQTLLEAGQLEPNAAALLMQYLATAK